MIKKIYSFFLIIFLLFFISSSVHAQNSIDNSLDKIGKTASDLKNVEKIPSAEDIGTIASAIKKVTETYQYIKSKITYIISYCQNFIESTKETRGKIESGGLKIKKYIEDKANSISKKYETNLPSI